MHWIIVARTAVSHSWDIHLKHCMDVLNCDTRAQTMVRILKLIVWCDVWCIEQSGAPHGVRSRTQIASTNALSALVLTMVASSFLTVVHSRFHCICAFFGWGQFKASVFSEVSYMSAILVSFCVCTYICCSLEATLNSYLINVSKNNFSVKCHQTLYFYRDYRHCVDIWMLGLGSAHHTHSKSHQAKLMCSIACNICHVMLHWDISHPIAPWQMSNHGR